MDFKTIVVHPERCTGCGDCEIACAAKSSQITGPGNSCIRVVSENEADNFFLPTTCQQCEEPLCLAACASEAIYRDEALYRILIRRDKCVGCRMCVSACPFGAMGFDEQRGKAYKCDLCGGGPECVRVCGEKALEFTDTSMIQKPIMLQAASRLAAVMRPRPF
ncbi:MAG: 4Fe-4S dicluster domain-containing protein [Desulfobacterales bacterium]|nr:4Fe-4S dicluster domain-containing protein [Desulfobacterales bacterium]